MHARDKVLRGKPLNGKKPRRPLGQENNTRFDDRLHTQVSHTIALGPPSLKYSDPPI